MKFRVLEQKDAKPVTELFLSVFSASEDDEEGRVICHLASELGSRIDNVDVHGFAAVYEASIVGAIFFSRLTFNVPVEVFVLSPVAVATAEQGAGVGQALIRFGIQEMAERKAEYITTYGDPSFYSKVGFHQISPSLIQPPFELSQPEGWLGQSLCGERSTFSELGRASCVAPLNDPVYW